MGYTCQTIEKHTNSFQTAENAMTHSCTRPPRGRGKDGSFYIFHSAEGWRDTMNLSALPTSRVQNVHCTSFFFSVSCLTWGQRFIFSLRHVTHQPEEKPPVWFTQRLTWFGIGVVLKNESGDVIYFSYCQQIAWDDQPAANANCWQLTECMSRRPPLNHISEPRWTHTLWFALTRSHTPSCCHKRGFIRRWK